MYDYSLKCTLKRILLFFFFFFHSSVEVCFAVVLFTDLKKKHFIYISRNFVFLFKWVVLVSIVSLCVQSRNQNQKSTVQTNKSCFRVVLSFECAKLVKEFVVCKDIFLENGTRMTEIV